MKPKRVKVVIREVVYVCPHCESDILNEEGQNQNEVVAYSGEIITCEDCGKPVVCPKLGSFMGQPPMGIQWPRLVREPFFARGNRKRVTWSVKNL